MACDCTRAGVGDIKCGCSVPECCGCEQQSKQTRKRGWGVTQSIRLNHRTSTSRHASISSAYWRRLMINPLTSLRSTTGAYCAVHTTMGGEGGGVSPANTGKTHTGGEVERSRERWREAHAHRHTQTQTHRHRQTHLAKAKLECTCGLHCILAGPRRWHNLRNPTRASTNTMPNRR